MLIKNPFKTIVVIVILFIPVCQSKSCIGTDIEKLENNCETVNGKPLVFRGSVDVNTILQKVKSIKTIEAGIEIIGTDFESFDFFNKALTTLLNGNGPAIILRENPKLKRLHFDSLNVIKGKGNVILLLDKTYFSTAINENKESLNDLVKLASIGREKPCSEKPVEVNRDEVLEESNSLVFVFGGCGAVFLIGAAVLVYYSYKKRAEDKNLKTKNMEDGGAKDIKKSGDVDGAGETAKKAPSLQGKIDEDPKKK